MDVGVGVGTYLDPWRAKALSTSLPTSLPMAGGELLLRLPGRGRMVARPAAGTDQPTLTLNRQPQP